MAITPFKVIKGNQLVNDHVQNTLNTYIILTSRPWAVKLGWQQSYISKMTYKPSKLGQTDLVFGL